MPGSVVNAASAVGAWLRREWLVLAALVMLAAVAAGGVGYFRSASSPENPALFGNDYLAFYAAGRMVLEGRPAAAYDHAAHAAEQVRLAAEAKGGGALAATYYFGYPPTYLAFVAPFAWLPYYASLFAFLGLTALLYLAAMWLIWPGWRTLVLALAVPNACIAFGFGQNGFLTAGLVGCALALLDRRPWIAGVLVGLLAVKPQL
ncbi:MAG TPA: glycosyltransferase family 87 protein, partial [Bauldia sp.]|nr:glycosyltransferase family 87 protein [Bauldia sp.]